MVLDLSETFTEDFSSTEVNLGLQSLLTDFLLLPMSGKDFSKVVLKNVRMTGKPTLHHFGYAQHAMENPQSKS